MAKRNKAKFPSKSRKSALRVEALEQRQLLATVTGGGFEVGSNITAPNGNVYDQVLMTGSQVTVSLTDAEIAANQVVRVSLLDPTGDIIQVEFSGPGSMTLSLDANGFAKNVQPANYNQTIDFSSQFGATAVGYAQGLATITISGSGATSNVMVYSVGPGNAFNPAALFDATHDGGDNVANIAQLRILNDKQGANGSTQFGGIRTGNVLYSAAFGEVGISAPGVTVGGPVIVGDIDALLGASNAALRFGNDSTFGNVVVAGGDLVQTNGVAIQTQGLAGVNQVVLQSGASSAVDNGAARFGRGTAVAASAPDQLTQLLNASTTFFNLNTGVTAVPNAFYNAADVTIDGTSNLTSYANKVLGNVTITGGLTDKQFVAARIGSLTVNGDVTNSLISTDLANANGANITFLNDPQTFLYGSTTTQGLIGNVNVTGNFTNSRVESVASIGNVAITGNASLTANAAAGVPLASFSSGPVHSPVPENLVSFQAYHGAIGTVSVGGTFTQSLAASTFASAQQGGIGNVTFTGAATQSAGTILMANDVFNGTLVLGVGNVVFGAGGTVSGLATVNDQTAWAAQATKAMFGNISSTGNLSVGGIALTNMGLGNVAVTGGNLTTTGAGAAGIGAALIGNLSGNAVTLGGRVASLNGEIGTVTAGTGAVTVSAAGAVNSATSLGAITGATDVMVAAGGTVVAATSIGNITSSGAGAGDTGLTVAGTITSGTTLGNLTAAKAVAVSGAVTGGTAVGNLTAGTTLAVSGAVTTVNGSIGNLGGTAVTVSGLVDANETAAATVANVGTVAASAGDLTVTQLGKIEAQDSIGNLSASAAVLVGAGINAGNALLQDRGVVSAIGGAIGTVTAGTTLTVTGDVMAGTNIGALLSAGNLTISAPAGVVTRGTVTAGVGAGTGNIGTVTSSGGNVAISGLLSADGNIGLVSADGTLTVLAASGAVSGTGASSKLDGFTSKGNMSIAGAVSSTATTNANGIGDFSVTGAASTLTVAATGSVTTTVAGSIGSFSSLAGALTIAGPVTTQTTGNIGNFTTTDGVITVSSEISTGTTGNIGNFLVSNNASLANANLENIIFTGTSLIEAGQDSVYGKDLAASAISTLMQSQGSVGTVTGSNLLLQGRIQSANDIGMITATNNNLDILFLNGNINARGSDSRIAGVTSIGSIDIENLVAGAGAGFAFTADSARNTFATANDTGGLQSVDNDNGIGSIISSNGNITLRANGKLSSNLALGQDFNGAGGFTTDDVDFTNGSISIIHAPNGSITTDLNNTITGGRVGNLTAGQLLTLNGNITASDGRVGTLISTGNAVQIGGTISAAGFARDITGGAERTVLVSDVSAVPVLETAAQAAERGDIGFNLGTTAFQQPSTVTGIRGALDLTLIASANLTASDDIGMLTSTLGTLTTAAGSVITGTGAGSNILGFLSSGTMTLGGTVTSAGTGLALGNAGDSNNFAKVIGSGSITVNGAITATAEGNIGNFSTTANSIIINAAISTTGVGGTGNIGTFTATGGTSDILIGTAAAGTVTTTDGVISAGEVGSVGLFTAGRNIVIGDGAGGGTVAGYGSIGGFTAGAAIHVGEAGAGTIGTAGSSTVGNLLAGTDIVIGGANAGAGVGLVTGATVGNFTATAGDINLGATAGGTGTITATTTVGNFSAVAAAGDIFIGSAALGDINGTGAGTFTAGNDILVGIGAAGSIDLTTAGVGQFDAGRDIRVGGAAGAAGNVTTTTGSHAGYSADRHIVVGGTAAGGTGLITATTGNIGNFASNVDNLDGFGEIVIGAQTVAGTISTTGAGATGSIGTFTSRGNGGLLVDDNGINIGALGLVTTNGTAATDIGMFTTSDRGGDILIAAGGRVTTTGTGDILGFSSTDDFLATSTGTIAVSSGASIGNVSATNSLSLTGGVAPGVLAAVTSIGNLSAGTTLLLNLGGGAGSDVTAGTTIGDITAKGSATLAAGSNITSGRSMGNLAFGGDITVSATGEITAGTVGTAAALTIGLGAGFAAGTAGNVAVDSIGNVTVNGFLAGTTANIEFAANAIGNVTVIGDSAAGAVLSNAIFQTTSGAETGSAAYGIGNIIVRNTSLLATSAVAGSAAPALTASTGTGFAAEGRIGSVLLYSGQFDGTKYLGNGRLTLDALSGLLVVSGDTDFGGDATALDAGTQVDMGDVRLVADFVSQATLAIAAGNGLVIGSGLDAVAAGNYNPTTTLFAVNAVNSKIGTVSLFDTNAGNVGLATPTNGGVATAFSSLIGAAEIGTISIFNNSSTVATETVTLSDPAGVTEATGIDTDNSNAVNGNEIQIVRL